jgi:lipopolysaccharide transport system ATP-binding protein
MNTDTAISVSHVSKRYTIGVQKDGSLRGTLAGLIGSKSANKQEEFWALNDVSFEIKKGEVIGIIGKNGAGKSTLLKILSQITKPTSGRIEISGRVASLLEVGTGFHPELSGRENIYLNGTILGMTRQEVKDKFDEIVAFSGVEKFIDTPVKHYSSGMYVRLAFAVAAYLEPEILIIDEVLAVGDAEFQKKCLGKMKEVAGHGRTVIFVSHNMAAVKSLCDSVILVVQGEVSFKGSVNQGIARYQGLNDNNEISGPLVESNEAIIHSIITRSRFDSSSVIDEYDSLLIVTDIEINQELELRLTFVLKNDKGEDLFAFSEKGLLLERGRHKVLCELPEGFLNIGDYFLDVYLINRESKTILTEKSISTINVIHGKRPEGAWMGKEPGFIKPKFKWELVQ